MNIIFVGRRHGKSKTLRLGNAQLVSLVFFVAALVVLLVYAGYRLNDTIAGRTGDGPTVDSEAIVQWADQLSAQSREIDKLKEASRERLDALTLRMGNMQARLLRLDALGQRLTDVAKLNNGEFDFRSPPALGGPIEADAGESYQLPDLLSTLDRIERQITDRQQQLEVIDELFVRRNIENELFIAGRPITWGWMSSAYGYRTDPFTGKRAWHAGVDFAGKEDSDIIAVASGVVTFSDDRYGYGNLVEINHGGGFVTRYAHCKELLVSVGTVVEKGQVIATMGSTGRSTGPHVHYEVLKHGRTIDPKKYILRASR